MTKQDRIKFIIAIAINVVIFALEVFCLCNFMKYLLEGNPDIRFRYYTNISNLTVGLITIPNIFFLVYSLIKEKIIYPQVLSIVKYMGITMTTLTFFTVLFLIAPLTSYIEMYAKVRFITHLVVPILVVISYLFFEEKTIFNWKYTFLSFVPPVTYAIIYVTNVIFLKRWPDMYKINEQGIWYVYVTILCIAGFGFGVGLYYLNKFIKKKRN